MDADKARNTIITGTNRGIGLAMVEKFAENGCNIWACARKPNPEFELKMSELAKKFGVWIKPVYFDLSVEEEIKAGIMSIFKEKKPVHTLINNAGIYYDKLFQMHTMKEIKEIFDVNVFALMYITQLTLRIMVRQKYGNIINVSSTTGLIPYQGAVCYGSAKAAVALFTRSLAIEIGGFGNIRVNAIAPGHTETDMTKHAMGKHRDYILSNCIMNRFAKPYEIANAAYYLASDEASFINGAIINVDGGERHGYGE